MSRLLSLPRLLSLAIILPLLAPFARAHDAFEITAVARVEADALVFDVTMSRSTALAIVTGDREAAMPSRDFARWQPQIKEAAARLYHLTGAGEPLALRSAEVVLDREEDVRFHLIFAPPGKGPLVIRAPHVVQLSSGYGDSLTVYSAGQAKLLGLKLLTADDDRLEIALPEAAAAPAKNPANPATPPAPPPATPTFRSFFLLGIEHILTGYDHLLFLCGLLVACRRYASMLGIITCFTIAHSITLALAALGVVTISGRIVEPLIAASIAFVGIENLLRRHEEPRGRWLLTFGFGLVHGFGFAGALRAAGLGAGGASVAVPLFSFNLGVEAGQLAVMIVLLPLLQWLRRRPAFVRYGLPAVSVVVTLAGFYWLVQRVVLT